MQWCCGHKCYALWSLIENLHKCDFLRGSGDKWLRGKQIVTASAVTLPAKPGYSNSSLLCITRAKLTVTFNKCTTQAQVYCRLIKLFQKLERLNFFPKRFTNVIILLIKLNLNYLTEKKVTQLLKGIISEARNFDAVLNIYIT